MTEEEYFRKTYPDSCYGDRLLSPYWDFFQDGVEFGEQQSEKRIAELVDLIHAERKRQEQCDDIHLKKIAELERENAELRNNGFTVSAMTEQQLKVALEKGEQLEKENAEWEKFVKDIQNRNEENYLKVCHKLATELNRGIELADQLTKAKDLLKNIIRVTWGEGWNYSLDWKVKAEQFLSEVEK